MGAAALAVAALLSRPLYEGLSWRSALPASIRTTVAELTPDTTVVGAYAGAEVPFALHPSTNRYVRVGLESQAFDPVLVVYQVKGDSVPAIQVARDDDGGEGNSSLLQFCAVGGQVYVIGVQRYADNAQGQFTLRLTSETNECAGLTSAGAALPTQGSTMQDAYTAAMRSDLRNLVTAEESFFADNVTYTSNLTSLNYTPSNGVTVVIGTATGTGWNGTSRHVATTRTCGIYVGSAPVAGQNEGEPRCIP